MPPTQLAGLVKGPQGMQAAYPVVAQIFQEKISWLSMIKSGLERKFIR